jgi:phosphoribosylamine--glycine ligase
MNVLLVGSGGREHALAWKIKQSPLLRRLVVAPGNPGIETLAETRPVKADDVEGLLALAQEIAADLVVVGPEAALAAGLADRLTEADIPCFGPSRKAAQLETSKAFTKAFAERHGVPTARHETFTDAGAAKAALERFEAPFVLKASGLAAGKGVVIAADVREAGAALDELFGGRFGAAGEQVVIEAFLQGEEASLFALTDGETVLPFGSAQDHKRLLDGDRGPNTGGMGTYAPVPAFSAELEATALARIVEPTTVGMAKEGTPYRGVLFAGLMLTDAGPQLIEFNARFGDPECQVLMLRLESDLLPYLQAAATGGLANLPPPVWRNEAAVCVVLAADGYPDAPVSGGLIEGAEAEFGPEVAVFHAGTRRVKDGALTASGGRVLNVCARGPTVEAARANAYAALDRISLAGGRFRRDIGARG